MSELSERSTKLQRYFDNGAKAMNDQDYDGAAAWFSAVLEYSPLDMEAQELCEKCQILHTQAKLNALTRIWARIAGEVCSSFGFHKRAAHYLGVSSFDKPQDALLAGKYAKSLMATDQPALASMSYKRALKFQPQNKTLLKGAGPAFEAIGDKPAAIEVFYQLQRLEPKNGQWPIKVKNLSAEHYGSTGGITDLKSARSEEEKKAATYNTAEGKEERIKELLDQYKEDPEEKKGLLPEVGRLLVQIERYDHGIAIWQRVAEVFQAPEVEEDEVEEGEESSEEEGEKKKVKVAPEIEESLFMIALCQEKRGDEDDAEAGYAQLHEEHPSDPRYVDSLYQLKLSRIDRGLEENAEDVELIQRREAVEKEYLEVRTEIYKRLTEARGGDADILLAYGNILREGGRLDEAIPVFQKAAQNPSRTYPALRALGAIFIEKGRMPLAVDTFKRALEKAPQSRTISREVKEIWYGLGEAYMGLGDKDNAREWFKKVYETDIGFEDVQEKYEALVG